MKLENVSSAEQQRLSALKAIAILDTPPEQIYQDAVDLAGLICDCPVSLISLVDQDRQWFKAKRGLDICETPRGISFCTHAIQQPEPLIVENALEDSRFSKNPLVVKDPNFRFYAGFPLTLTSGHRVGTLCILDTVPRNLTHLQIDSLKIIARQIISHFEHRVHEIERQTLIAEVENQRLHFANSTKMASLGEMAAGIAHEINNPLSAILGWTAELDHSADHQELNRARIKQISHSIERVCLRISKTVKALRTFARDGTTVKIESCSVASIFEETLELCRGRFADRGIQLKIDIPPTDLTIECRGVEISQILLNLLNNSLDAIADLPEKWVTCNYKSTNDQVELTVQDSGLCPPPEIREKMMNPFFTTKTVGKGTGLGLSISQRIAQSHGGTLALVPEKHTKFVLTLPKIAKV